MSRKITSFLMLLVAMFFSTNAMAQEEMDLATKSVSVGAVVSEFEPNTWYLLHQGRDAGTGTGQYAPVLAGEVPSYGGFLYDQGAGENILKPGVMNLEEEQPAKTVAGFLVRFVPTENEGAYNIQFGTGNWMSAPPGTGNSQKFTSTENVYDAGEFNIYFIDQETAPGAIGINVYDMGQRIDNNFAGATGINTGNTVVTWGSGKHETVLNESGMIVSNSIWSITEIVWGDIELLDAAIKELEAAYQQYFEYSGTFIAGTEPGQYGEAEVAAFEAALQAAYDAAEEAQSPDGAGDWTVEKLQAVKQALIDAYNAVVASQVKIQFASGYYFIKNGYSDSGISKWTETVTNEETGEEETIYVDKYMTSGFSGSDMVGMWRSVDLDDVVSSVPALWKITANGDDTYDVQNMATKGRFNNVTQSNPVTMDPESENMMAFDYVGNTDGVIYVDIRVSSQAANGYLYLHTGGHASGAGKSGNLVGWSCGKTDTGYGATEWTLVPVEEELALQMIEDYAPYADREKMVENYKEMVADAQAKIEIAKDIQVNLDEENPLITEVSQFSSPYTETREGSIEALLGLQAESSHPNDAFWHSDWSSSVPGGTHYLQVEMPDMEVANAAFQFTRRNVPNDHITEWGVMGTNEFDAEKDACELLATISTPKNANDETLVSDVFPTNGYKYLRFYCNNTTGTGNGTRGYFHIARFQLYPAEVLQSETCQYNVMGDLVKNLEGIIAEQADIEDADLTLDEYNKLKEAYDAFIEKFVDPAALREALEGVSGTAESIVVGTDPGFWPAGSSAATLLSTIEAAKAYDAAGDYTPAQSEKYIEDLNGQSADVFASAIGIKEGKWYRIRFATEEDYDAHGWDKVAGNGVYNAEKDIWTAPNLWGKYVAVANVVTEESGNVEIEEAEEAALGHDLHFYGESVDDFANKDMGEFRFVAVGDSAYILQNKATNLFLKAAGTSGAVTLSAHPSLFNVSAIGYGFNIIAAKSLTGEPQSYLHAQVGGNILVTWNVNTLATRSALYIEEAEDVASDYAGTDFNVSVLPGEVKAFCFPVEISAGEGGQLWTVNSLEGTKVTLAKIDKAEAGRPFIFVKGDAEKDYDAEAEAEMGVLKLTFEPVTAPVEAGALKGVFANTTVGAGVLVPEGNSLVVSKRSSTAVSANGAYVSGEEPIADLEATVEVVWSDAADSLTEVMSKLAKTGEAYTLDGRLVSRKANLNDLSRYGKGIYILNGVKVIVK